jgi:hypothetical protein
MREDGKKTLERFDAIKEELKRRRRETAAPKEEKPEEEIQREPQQHSATEETPTPAEEGLEAVSVPIDVELLCAWFYMLNEVVRASDILGGKPPRFVGLVHSELARVLLGLGDVENAVLAETLRVCGPDLEYAVALLSEEDPDVQ